jgi:hypothetical protein
MKPRFRDLQKRVEQRAVLWRNLWSKWLQRSGIEVAPVFEISGRQHLRSAGAVAPADLGADNTPRMPAMLNRWPRIVTDPST